GPSERPSPHGAATTQSACHSGSPPFGAKTRRFARNVARVVVSAATPETRAPTPDREVGRGRLRGSERLAHLEQRAPARSAFVERAHRPDVVHLVAGLAQ